MNTDTSPWIDDNTFHMDVNYLETLWHRTPIHGVDLPLIDIGEGRPLVFVPILEQLEFVYARQVRTLSQSRRVILYRRQESRTIPVSLDERAEELLHVIDALGLEQTDFLGHGDAAMVLFTFALRYPQRCRSLSIISQAADYRIAPHPFIWLLHELFLRLPVEHILPAWFLRRTVVNYIMARSPYNNAAPSLPRHLVEEQFKKIALWPFVYKFSVLPIIHSFTITDRLQGLTMPIFQINRTDDALAPEVKTAWLVRNLPNSAGYHVVSGGERFFLYSQAEQVTPLLDAFLASLDAQEEVGVQGTHQGTPLQ